MQPEYSKTFVCLASSYKHGGRCIAGRDIESWIRPVSVRPTEEISFNEQRFSDGTYPMVGDVLQVSFLNPAPRTYQSENHLIDQRRQWSLVQKVTFDQLMTLSEPVTDALWQNGHSSKYGTNDYVPLQTAEAYRSSLEFIAPDMVVLRRQIERYRKKIRVEFSLNDHNYVLICTDPWVHKQSQSIFQGRDAVTLQGALVCVSLGEPYGNDAYKLAASVITKDRIGR